MEFIRWIILSWEKPLFVNGGIIPCIMMTLILTVVSYLIHFALGITISMIALAFWGLVAYVYISREVKAFYAQYQKEKDNGPKAP